MKTITPETELAQLRARETALTQVVQQKREREQQDLARKVESLKPLFGTQDLKKVIQLIREHGHVRVRAEVDDAKTTRIVSLLRSGVYTVKQIAQIEGVSIPTVHNIRIDAKIPAKRGRPAKMAA